MIVLLVLSINVNVIVDISFDINDGIDVEFQNIPKRATLKININTNGMPSSFVDYLKSLDLKSQTIRIYTVAISRLCSMIRTLDGQQLNIVMLIPSMMQSGLTNKIPSMRIFDSRFAWTRQLACALEHLLYLV